MWDVDHIVPDQSVIGRFLTAIFGYNANPSLVEVLAYVGYLGLTLASYFWPARDNKGGEPIANIEQHVHVEAT